MGDSSGSHFKVEDSAWTWEEDKKFEDGLVKFPEDSPDRWGRIAAVVVTKTAAEVERHFAVLLADVAAIEAGLVELPEYTEENVIGGEELQKNPNSEKRQLGIQRKVAKPWTVEEHKLFLLGLEKYGKSDWKSISRYMVKTRNASQVASHAQKYYERLEKEEERKKRRSIFDTSIAESKSFTP